MNCKKCGNILDEGIGNYGFVLYYSCPNCKDTFTIWNDFQYYKKKGDFGYDEEYHKNPPEQPPFFITPSDTHQLGGRNHFR